MLYKVFENLTFTTGFSSSDSEHDSTPLEASLSSFLAINEVYINKI
jgi:hypothetical protein